MERVITIHFNNHIDQFSSLPPVIPKHTQICEKIKSVIFTKHEGATSHRNQEGLSSCQSNLPESDTFSPNALLYSWETSQPPGDRLKM